MALNPLTFEKVAAVIRDHFNYRGEITPETVAIQVHGWDSLAHTIVVMKVEEVFNVELEEGDIFGLRNVGDLVEAVQRRLDA